MASPDTKIHLSIGDSDTFSSLQTGLVYDRARRFFGRDRGVLRYFLTSNYPISTISQTRFHQEPPTKGYVRAGRSLKLWSYSEEQAHPLYHQLNLADRLKGSRDFQVILEHFKPNDVVFFEEAIANQKTHSENATKVIYEKGNPQQAAEEYAKATVELGLAMKLRRDRAIDRMTGLATGAKLQGKGFEVFVMVDSFMGDMEKPLRERLTSFCDNPIIHPDTDRSVDLPINQELVSLVVDGDGDLPYSQTLHTLAADELSDILSGLNNSHADVKRVARRAVTLTSDIAIEEFIHGLKLAPEATRTQVAQQVIAATSRFLGTFLSTAEVGQLKMQAKI